MDRLLGRGEHPLGRESASHVRFFMRRTCLYWHKPDGASNDGPRGSEVSRRFREEFSKKGFHQHQPADAGPPVKIVAAMGLSLLSVPISRLIWPMLVPARR